MIGVHVGHPLLGICPELGAGRNAFGWILLKRLLELALVNEELILPDSCAAMGGDLQDCVILALVTDETAAVQVLKRELDRVCLLPFCQIGLRIDAATWECLYPSRALRVSYLFDLERQEAALQDVARAHDGRLQLLRGLLEQIEQQRNKEQGHDEPDGIHG
jgi:hypothetical protein